MRPRGAHLRASARPDSEQGRVGAALVRHAAKHATPRNPDINRMNHTAHAGIFNAILKRDPGEAEELLRSHLTTAWQFVRSTFDRT